MTALAEHPAPVLEVRNLSVRFPLPHGMPFTRRNFVHAVEDVSFAIAKGETLGIVGESGSGKTTVGRAALLRTPLTAGRILFNGIDITDFTGEERRKMQRFMQLVFQDPYGSLNARMKVWDIVAEPLIVYGVFSDPRDLRARVAELLAMVGLPEDAAQRYPHSFSGGQRQRIGIARALAISPEFIVADEPVSALDVSVRAQVINIFKDLQEHLQLTYLFIAHDLAIVRHISHRIAVMYAGRIVEIGDSTDICDNPRHPYTRALLEAVLEPDPKARRMSSISVGSEPPNVVNMGLGCSFRHRCPLAVARCGIETPQLTPVDTNQRAACFVTAALE